jgi:NADH-quinone oxidoreductase subunit B
VTHATSDPSRLLSLGGSRRAASPASAHASGSSSDVSSDVSSDSASAHGSALERGASFGLGPTASAPQPVDIAIDGQTLALHLAEAGLACCAVEQAAGVALLERAAALAGEPAVGSAAAPVADGQPAVIAVLVVSGTVTDVMAPLIEAMYEAMPEPRAVLSFGACSATGGPYWDSPVVMNGIDQRLPVDVYVPGCPPRPEALLSGLAALVDLRAHRSRPATGERA